MGKKKTIMILGAGEEQCEAIDIALSLDLKVVALDSNPKAPGLNLADIGVCTDINNVGQLIDIGNRHKIDGVMTHAVEIPQIVAQVAKALNLPGIKPEVAERATNKLMRISCLTEKGIPCPKYNIAKNYEDAKKWSAEIGFPCVFKPVENSGARGVIKVNKVMEIKDAFKHSTKYSQRRNVLIEEYIDGKELSTESIIYDNKIYTVAFADRNYDRNRFAPFFVEDGGEMPSHLSDTIIKEVGNLVNASIDALGINWGVAKGDVIIDNKGYIYILEMAARTSGGRFSSLKVPLATGINMLRPLILMTVGLTPDLNDLVPKYNRGVAERFIFPDPGRITSIEGILEAKQAEGIYRLHLNEELKVGTYIKKATNNAMRQGYVIAVGDNREQAIERAKKAVKMLKITTEEK